MHNLKVVRRVYTVPTFICRGECEEPMERLGDYCKEAYVEDSCWQGTKYVWPFIKLEIQY